MQFQLEHDKQAIRRGDVFKGLCVDNVQHWVEVFLREAFQLVSVWKEGKRVGAFIFELAGGEFHFRLINCRPSRGGVIEGIIQDYALPYARAHGLKAINATVERQAMAVKLQKLGFRPQGGKLWRLGV